MTLSSLLQNGLLTLPKNWRLEGYSSYYEAVIKIGLEYLNLLEELNGNEISGTDPIIGVFNKDQLIRISRATYQSVLNCIRVYLDKGDPTAAYGEFAKHFSSQAISNDRTRPVFALNYISLYPRHYRLRESFDKIDNAKELFHVPFEKRHLINSYRYSIPGYPTLYLSNSVYLAFRELNEPDYDNIYVSKLMFNYSEYDSSDLLDLTNNLPIGDNMTSLYKYLARWPLLMACSIKVGHPTATFKQEYILPQIVLLWVKNNIKIGNGKKVIGVAYSSSKINFNPNYSGHFYNTAIPVHSASREGFCDVLKRQFSITKPISFQDALKLKLRVEQTMQVKSINRNGSRVNYIETDFGKIESVLDTPPYSNFVTI